LGAAMMLGLFTYRFLGHRIEHRTAKVEGRAMHSLKEALHREERTLQDP
jgi:hypothetical protein